MTGLTEDDKLVMELKTLGIKDVFHKPVQLDELMAKVEFCNNLTKISRQKKFSLYLIIPPGPVLA